MRRLLSSAGGLLTAFTTFIAFQMLGARWYPMPEGMDSMQLQQWISALPSTAYALIVGGYALGSFLCGMVIRLIHRDARSIQPMLVGAFLMLAGIANVFSNAYPVSVSVLSLLCFVPCTLMGFRLAARFSARS